MSAAWSSWDTILKDDLAASCSPSSPPARPRCKCTCVPPNIWLVASKDAYQRQRQQGTCFQVSIRALGSIRSPRHATCSCETWPMQQLASLQKHRCHGECALAWDLQTQRLASNLPNPMPLTQSHELCVEIVGAPTAKPSLPSHPLPSPGLSIHATTCAMS